MYGLITELQCNLSNSNLDTQYGLFGVHQITTLQHVYKTLIEH